MRTTIKRRFKDSFKAKGEAIGPMFLRNAENTLTFPESSYINHTLSLAPFTPAILKKEACFSLLWCLCRCLHPLNLKFPNFRISG